MTGYMTGHYHTDTGEGCDAYSAGTSRGCGGTGLWADHRLWVSRNFVDSRVLANGPIRVMFELVYEPFDVNGMKISEVKRITLDAGSQMDRFENFYRVQGQTNAVPLTVGIGFKKIQGARKEFNAENGSLVIWEPMAKNLGMQGLAAIVSPKVLRRTEPGQAEPPVVGEGERGQYVLLPGRVCLGQGRAVHQRRSLAKARGPIRPGTALPGRSQPIDGVSRDPRWLSRQQVPADTPRPAPVRCGRLTQHERF